MIVVAIKKKVKIGFMCFSNSNFILVIDVNSIYFLNSKKYINAPPDVEKTTIAAYFL